MRAIGQRRSWGQRLLLVLNVGMIGASLSLAWLLNLTYEQVASIERVELSDTLTVAPSTKPGERVLNVLLVGYDSSEGLDADDPINVGRQGERFGDVTMILRIDERQGTAAMLSVPRDLWVPIEGYGDKKFNYAFGIGGPELLIDTIEEQFDIPIHHYISVDFAGFQGLVEAVGHVDVYFDQPSRDWNAEAGISQTGFEMLSTGCQPLDPPTALAYVRSRYYQVQEPDGTWVDSFPPSDIGRIQRQQDFMYRLMRRAISAGARNPFTLADLVKVSLKQLVIDEYLTPQLLLDLGDTYRSFDPGELRTYSYPSDHERVNSLWVLLPMEDDANAVLEIFRGTPDTDPSTVLLTVEVDASVRDRGAELFDLITAQGFDIDGSAVSSSNPGITLYYGPDGLQAAQLVEIGLRNAGVTEPIVLELAGGDPFFNIDNQGRSITMAIGAAPEVTSTTTSSSTPDSSPATPPSESGNSSTTTSIVTTTTAAEIAAQTPVTTGQSADVGDDCG